MYTEMKFSSHTILDYCKNGATNALKHVILRSEVKNFPGRAHSSFHSGEKEAVLRKRNASIKKCHKNAKIKFTKAQEKEYGRNAWHNCTKAHNAC